MSDILGYVQELINEHFVIPAATDVTINSRCEPIENDPIEIGGRLHSNPSPGARTDTITIRWASR